LKKTPLHQNHLDMAAKMGEFAGYDMPLYYGEGVMAEHLWTRSNAGLFDVSHMGQIEISGPGAVAFWQKLTPSYFEKKAHGRAQYTVLSNEQGGMIDDLIVTRMGDDRFFAVVNAGCKDKDIEWIKSHLPDDLTFTYFEGRALVALQGPKAEAALARVSGIDLADMPYMFAAEAKLPDGTDILISRLGYTGEDGFEIAVPQERAAAFWEELLACEEIKPVGLAARDSLRLEMGYPLYGHDIDDTTSPVEADIGWIMGPKTKGGNNTDFIGAARVLREREEGASRKRVGIKLTGKGVAREGAEIRNVSDEKIGELTSGGHSPSLKESIGQGYIDPAYTEIGTKILVNVRGRNIEAVIAPMPFIPASTKSMKKKQAA